MIRAPLCSAAALISLAALPPLAAADDAGGQPVASKPMPANASLSLRLPKAEEVVFNGVVSFDGAGGATGSMMYPAPNAAGLIAAVITHGFISEGVRQSEKEKLREAADKVLLSYQPVLKDYKHRELMQRALQRMRSSGARNLVDAEAQPAGDIVIDSAPSFLMAQDQTGIILDNAIRIFGPDALSAPVYQSAIRVVARPIEQTDPAAYWTSDQGEKLKQETATLLAASLELALSDSAGLLRKDAPYKTVRYLEGKTEKMERAQVLSDVCDRMVIRTLRESLMSVPIRRRDARSEECGSRTILD